MLIIVYYYKILVKDYGPHTKYHNKGYAKKSDNLSIILDRISWANNYNGRLDITPRFVLVSIIIVILLSIFIQNRLPEPLIFTQCIFITYVCCRSIYYYCRHHCDKFSNYAIEHNIKILRKKLKLKSGLSLSANTQKKKSNSSCCNFTFKTEF